MFEIYEKVKIKKNGIIGTIIDISKNNGSDVYVVESDRPGETTGYGGLWKMFDCSADEIEKMN